MPAGLQSSSMVPNKRIACSERSDTAPIRRLERCSSNSRCVARPPDDRIFGILIQGYHSSLMCELRRSRGACLDRQTGLSGLPLPKVFSYGGRTHRYWRDPTFGSLARRSSSRGELKVKRINKPVSAGRFSGSYSMAPRRRHAKPSREVTHIAQRNEPGTMLGGNQRRGVGR